MSPEAKSIKKIIVEVPSDLHSEFKSAVYKDGRSIKMTIIEFIELYIKAYEKDRAKKEKNKLS